MLNGITNAVTGQRVLPDGDTDVLIVDVPDPREVRAGGKVKGAVASRGRILESASLARADCPASGEVDREPSMTLAPIRGAPPGAPIPDFPLEEPRAKPAELGATPASGEQPPISPIRRRHMPIQIGGGGIALTFRVIPELPAIARPSMTVHIIAESHPFVFLQLSAGNARAFLTDLRNGCSPIVATGDEGGTVQVEIGITEAGLVLSICKPGHRDALHRWIIGRIDLATMADELLADLGA